MRTGTKTWSAGEIQQAQVKLRHSSLVGFVSTDQSSGEEATGLMKLPSPELQHIIARHVAALVQRD